MRWRYASRETLAAHSNHLVDCRAAQSLLRGERSANPAGLAANTGGNAMPAYAPFPTAARVVLRSLWTAIADRSPKAQ